MSEPSIFEKTKDILPVYYCYTVFGILAFVSNLVIIVVYLSNNLLRSRFSMYAGLAVADMINGLGFIVTGLERLRQEYSLMDVYSIPIMSRYECALQVGNMLQVVGSQWPALITLSLGLERFCAVRYPMSYRQFKTKMFHGLLIASFVISLISIAVGLYIGLVVQRNSRSFYVCTLSNAYGFEYSTFNYFLTMICHVVGFTFNISAFGTVKKTAKRVGFYNRILSREYRKVKIILIVSLLSLIMVVFPNLFLYVTRFIQSGVNPVILGWVYCLFVLRSIFNFWVIGFGVPEFKVRFFEVFIPCFASSANPVPVADSKVRISLQDHVSQKKNSAMVFKVATIG
ncbi:hypothetical protein FO519_003142 [Halicephalobus sp. NKZ332]|nr:hypothetical protein FO519_003142 [Halicephalobus sp. NKZ332]